VVTASALQAVLLHRIPCRRRSDTVVTQCRHRGSAQAHQRLCPTQLHCGQPPSRRWYSHSVSLYCSVRDVPLPARRSGGARSSGRHKSGTKTWPAIASACPRAEHGTRCFSMTSALAPDVSHFGGGIQKTEVGARTNNYVQYFAADATAKDADALTEKRLANYQDVVNSCASQRVCPAAMIAPGCRVRDRGAQRL